VPEVLDLVEAGFCLQRLLKTPEPPEDSRRLLKDVSMDRYHTPGDFDVAPFVPTAEVQRDHGLWTLARAVRRYYEPAAPEVADIFDRWYTLAVPIIKTKDRDLNQAEFYRKLVLVENPGTEWKAEALKLAPSCPLVPPPWSTVKRTAALVWAVNELLAVDGVFWLCCRDAGELLDVSHAAAAKLLLLLKTYHWLSVVRPPTPNRMANRYIFTGPGLPLP